MYSPDGHTPGAETPNPLPDTTPEPSAPAQLPSPPAPIDFSSFVAELSHETQSLVARAAEFWKEIRSPMGAELCISILLARVSDLGESASTFTRIAAVALEFEKFKKPPAFEPRDLEAAEVVIQHSKERHNDLTLIHRLRSSNTPANPSDLRKFYAAGHHYVPHALNLLPDLAQKRPRGDQEYLRLYAEFAKQPRYPNLQRQGEVIRSLAPWPPASRAPGVHVYSALMAADSEQELQALHFVRERMKDDPETFVDAIKALEVYTGKDLVLAISLVREVATKDPFLLEFYLGDLRSGDLAPLTRELFRMELKEDRSEEKPLEEVRASFLKREYSYSEAVPEEDLDRACALYRRILEREPALEALSETDLAVQIKSSLKAIRERSVEPGANRDDDKVEILALAREAFRREFKIRPYNTQIIEALLLVDEKLLEGKDGLGYAGVYQQIKTGEGKSLVLALVSTYLATLGRKIDVITSNPYLAKRDVMKFEEYYELFGISCDKFDYDPEAKESPPNPDVLYTTNDSLVFAYLSARMEGLPFFEGKRLDVALVDESDNLLLDLSGEGCRISTKVAPLFSEDALKRMASFAKGPDARYIVSDPMEAAKRFAAGFPEVSAVSPGILSLYLTSALQSQALEERVDYVVQGSKIVIVDKDQTGRLRSRTQWNLGLHDFVALRHGLPLSKQRGLAAQMSHPEFLTKYKLLCCISGTIGDAVDREEIRALYHLRGFDAPPHHASQRADEPITLFPTAAKWKEALCARVQEHTDIARARSVLVTAATIKKAQELRVMLGEAGMPAALLSDFENVDAFGKPANEHSLVAQAGEPRSRLIGTGVIGRGADIVPSPECAEDGGVDVICTDIPVNERAERQIRGRAGRQGRKGSSCILACVENDHFLENVAPELRGLISTLAEREDFGPAHQETRACIQFARQYHNLSGALLRRIRYERRAIAQDLQRSYFDALSGVVRDVYDRYPDLKPGRDGANLGNPFLDSVRGPWAGIFNSLDLLLAETERQAERELAARDFTGVQPASKGRLLAAFNTSFGYPFETVLDAPPEALLYRKALRMTVNSCLENLARIEARSQLPKSEAVMKYVSDAKGKIEGWMNQIRKDLAAGNRPPPRADAGKSKPSTQRPLHTDDD